MRPKGWCAALMTVVMLTSPLAPYSATPAHAAANNTSTFMFKNATTFNGPNLDMVQGYTPLGASTSCPGALGSNWTCTWSSDTFAVGQVMAAGTTTVDLYAENNVSTIVPRSGSTSAGITPATITPLAAPGALRSIASGDLGPVGLPAGLQPDDLLLMVVEARDVVAPVLTIISPSGWNKLYENNNGTGSRAALFWKRMGNPVDSTGPTIDHSSSGNLIMAQIFGFSNVDWAIPANPFDATTSASTASAADNTVESAAITTVTEWARLVFVAHMADNHASIALPGGWTQVFFSASTAGNDGAISAHYSNVMQALPWPAITGTVTFKTTSPTSTNAVSNGAQLALRPKPQDLSIGRPASTLQDDVMIASIALRSTNAVITKPSGWTEVRRIDNPNSTANSLAVYWKLAGDAVTDPGPYVFQFSPAAHAAGGIKSYGGVDTTNPIHFGTELAAARNTPVAPDPGTEHRAPAMTTTVANAMLVTSYGVANPDTWTCPTCSMTEAFDQLAGSASESVAQFYSSPVQAVAGTTGEKKGVSSTADVGNAHILALRPAPRTGTLTVQLLHNAAVIGSTTVNVTSPGTPALVTASFATSGVTFANGDRLHVKVIAPNDAANVNARVWFDGATRQSRLVVPTITTGCARPADPTYVAATAAAGQVTLQWSSANPIVIIQKPDSAVSETPLDGTSYDAGAPLGVAGASVIYSGTSATDGSFTKTGLVNGTTYHYKAFAKTASQCYSAALDTALDATPPTGGNPAWSYTLVPGGSMLKPGISGYGAIYTGSNSGRIIALDTSSGVHLWDPVTTSGVVQGWLSWLPGGWQYRKQITIDRTKVSADLTDFPVLISFTDPDLQSSAQPGTSISHVGSAAAAAAAVTLPAHEAGDLIIVFAARSAGAAPETVPSLPTGWTNIGTSQRDFWATRVGYKVAASSSETTGTWTNAVRITALVYRGTDPTAPIGATATAGSSSGNVTTYPTLALSGSTTPWVVGVAGHRTADNVEVAPAGMTNRVSNGAGFPAEVAAHDTNGGVLSWSAQTVSMSGTGAWDAWTIEIKPQTGGGDIVFTASDGATPLSHEIEQYDGTTGKLTAWVRVPSLSSTTDTVLYMYYGDATAPDQQDRANVWDGNFKGVWHLREDPAGAAPQIQDSTSNAAHGTSVNMTSADQVPGKVGGALKFIAGASGSVVDMGDKAIFQLPVYSWSMWIKGDTAPTCPSPPLGNEQPLWNADAQFNFSWGHTGCTFMQAAAHTDGTWRSAKIQTSLFGSTWYHVAATYGSGELKVYLNGILEQTTPHGAPVTNAGSFAIGNGVGFTRWGGQLDEVRVGNTVRPAAWFLTEYNNQSAPGTIPTTAGTFYTVGAAEQTVTGGTVIGGDQSGRVYSVDAFIGATNWTANLSAKADAVQAGVAVQMRTYSNAAFRAQYTTDVIFAASRNTTVTNCGTFATNNKLFALRGDTGASLWTFNDTCTYSIDYIVGMPYVDYARNRLYVATRGTGSTLWILDSLDGSVVQQLALGNLETSPALSADGTTIYVSSAPGTFYAVDTTTFTTRSFALGSGIKAVIWEDWGVSGRLYFTTMDGNVWCLTDNDDGTFTQVWKIPVAGASTPLLLDKLYVGSSDGRMHEFDTDGGNEKVFPTTGTLDGAAFVGDVSTDDGTHVFVGTSGGRLFKIQVPLP
jgi:hypothetical protein